ncbi:hypothetical protein [Microbacterium sp.]|uniref:hypothetical protein n=1 Tax=Microbacterium sp. TaxID=51671 RepID=UPI0035B27ED4
MAFFRNVNQGQRGHPFTADLLAAFTDAGFPDAVPFQSNGTVIFHSGAPAGTPAPAGVPARARAPARASDSARASDRADPDLDGILEDVRAALTARCGVDREVFGMPLRQVVELVDVHATAPDAARRELTLHRGGIVDLDDPVAVEEAARRRCRLVATGAGWTIAINERDRESNATPVLGHLTGGPATSRGLPTLIRLVERFAT